jgi:hypothetical protein
MHCLLCSTNSPLIVFKLLDFMQAITKLKLAMAGWNSKQHMLQEMDQELERYHKSNEQLDLTISDLKLKQDGLKTEVLAQRFTLGEKEGGIKQFQHDLHEVAQSLQVRRAMLGGFQPSDHCCRCLNMMLLALCFHTSR